MLIAVHKSLISPEVTVAGNLNNSHAMEILCVEIKSNHSKLLLMGVYIPFYFLDHLYKDVANFIEEVSISSFPENVILCGDLNIPGIR